MRSAMALEPMPEVRDVDNAIDRLPVGVFACEFDIASDAVRMRYHNRQLAAVFGLDPKRQVDPTAILSAAHRKDLARMRALLATTSLSGSERRAEFRVRLHGATRWIEIRALVQLEPDGCCVVSGCCWDITARKIEERAFVARKHRETGGFRLQSQALPIGFMVAAADEAVTINDWNPAAERIFGYTREEAIGKSALHLIVPPEDWQFVRDAVRPGGDAMYGNAGIARNLRKDGRRIWCRWVNTPIRNAAGVVTGVMAMVRDVSDEMQTEERMRLWGSVIQQSTEAIMICDARQRILLVNKAFEDITGYHEGETIGHTPRILQSGRQDREFYRRMWESVAATGQWRGEIWNRRKTGELYVEWLALSAVRDSHGAVTHYIGIFSDITSRKETEERVRYLALYDALTGLPNRSFLIDRAAQILAEASRAHRKAALLFLDLDRFKNINDSMGHEAGDELLKIVARRLQNTVRASDIVARMGGDEFIILLGDIESPEMAGAIADKVIASLNAPIVLHNHELSVSGSVGICLFPTDARDVSELFRNADAAMYCAKSSGRNMHRFYTRDMNDRAMEILATEAALRRAIERNEFVVHYQPQIDLPTGTVVGLEALIRWQRPGVGLVMPGDFIPIAEERGLIGAIGQWTLAECARQAAEWDRAGAPPLPIALNLSASEFHRQGFAEQVEAVIRSEGLHPGRIELEVTESVILRDADATIAILQRLHQFGVGLSIDDFGTGYSSLSYLRRFPIDRIKIDRSFVNDMMVDHGAAGIVRGIIALAKSLNLQVVAEGVESEAQVDFLRSTGCDHAQGFFFSRGLAPTELSAWLWVDLRQPQSASLALAETKAEARAK